MKDLGKSNTTTSTGKKEESMRDFKEDKLGDIEDRGAEGFYITDGPSVRGAKHDIRHYPDLGIMEG